MSKIYSEDAYSIGLLLLNNATNGITTMARKNTLEQYYKCVNDNLTKMGVPDIHFYSINNEELIYNISCDEYGEVFLILRSDIELDKVQSRYLGILPLNFVIAAEKENALAILGLKLENGNLKVIEKEKSRNMIKR